MRKEKKTQKNKLRPLIYSLALTTAIYLIISILVIGSIALYNTSVGRITLHGVYIENYPYMIAAYVLTVLWFDRLIRSNR